MSLHFSVLLSLYFKESPVALRQSLVSIFNQTLLPDEVILVKDGLLTDELEKVLEEFQHIFSILKIVSLTKNQGLGRALNEGLNHCSYDLVARTDTDDIAKRDRFEKQVRKFDENPDLDLVGAWIDEFEGNTDNVVTVRKVPEYHDDICLFAKKRCPVNHPVVMFRKSAVLKAGGYKHFPLFEDYYLWVRMLMNGAKFYNIQESLLFFRFSSDMFKRRGGYRYAMDELRLQFILYRTGFIGKFLFLENVLIRFISRLMPNKLRTLFYKKVLRN